MKPDLRPVGAPGALGVAAAMVSATLRVAIVPLFVTPILDDVVGTGNLDALPRVLLVTGAAVLLMAITLALQDALLARGGAEVAAQLRERSYRALLQRQPGALPGTSGGLAGRIISDLREVETFHQYGLGTLVAETTTILGILTLLAWRDPLATTVLVALGFPASFALVRLGRQLRASTHDTQAGTEDVAAHLQEGLKHHAAVRAFRADPFMLDRFRMSNDATRRAATRRSALAAVQVPVTQVGVFLALATLVSLLAGRAASGALTTGQVVEYVALVSLLATPAQLLPRGYALLRQADAALERIMALVMRPPHDATAPAESGEPARRHEIPVSHGPVQSEGLYVHDVWVRHEAGPWVLTGANGATGSTGLLVVRGESGAGKSTLLATLLGFRDVEQGFITWRGAPIDPSRVAWVPQSLDLLRGPLRDALAFGIDAADEAIWTALGDVGMGDVVRHLPQGLDTRLEEDGAGLSGGQRQRLLVARALLRRPDILLLDEPTANLDEESERKLIATLRHEATRRLVIAVAHRDTLPRVADQVWTLADGILLEEDA